MSWVNFKGPNVKEKAERDQLDMLFEEVTKYRTKCEEWGRKVTEAEERERVTKANAKFWSDQSQKHWLQVQLLEEKLTRLKKRRKK